ncbi:hypothetical protein EJ110_NYTH56746 [Nymphaea thermarum]|nr:hypothetical protein EJ110_NYTH56746 [Nymphaea thermarum]
MWPMSILRYGNSDTDTWWICLDRAWVRPDPNPTKDPILMSRLPLPTSLTSSHFTDELSASPTSAATQSRSAAMAGDGDRRRQPGQPDRYTIRYGSDNIAANKGKGVPLPTGSSCGSGSAASIAQEDRPPLRSHVKIIEKAPKEFTGSYTRVKAHLLNINRQGIKACKKINKESLHELKKEQEAFEKKKGTTSSGYIDIASILNADVKDGTEKRKVVDVTQNQKSIKESFSLQGRQELDLKVATFFYANCIPFNVARSPYWRDLVTYIANCNLSGYVPPSSERFRTVLLEQQKTRMNETSN